MRGSADLVRGIAPSPALGDRRGESSSTMVRGGAGRRAHRRHRRGPRSGGRTRRQARRCGGVRRRGDRAGAVVERSIIGFGAVWARGR